ncbi:MAG: hypothetical protein HYZ57_09495 [Acidobacteria bacterium]|nr:hypothetical protein [Acidobacteriota bacterium]MBI3280061.1 hypothetical protein [Acidobacteriota bacterium]
MNHDDAREPVFDRAQRMALLVGIAALAATAVGAFLDSGQFFRSYLIAYLFWLGLALGSLGILMLHNLAGGRWGVLIRRFLESAARTLPLMAALVIPILLGIPSLYEWSHQDVVAHDPVLLHKQGYLNVPFFVARTVFYFALWMVLLLLLRRRSPEDLPASSSRAVAGPGLILFVFSVTFASVDWIMSLEPHWFSTIYGAILVVGQTLQTFAFCVALLVILSRYRPFAGILQPGHFHDLGNLLLAFTVLWAYTSFSQFLIIWSGNIPEETPWYIRRSNGGWQFVSVALVTFHFFVPFAILLSRYVKRRGRLLARVAVAIIVVRFIDLYWWVEPSYHQSFGLHWMHLVALLGVGGVWLFFFLWQLRRGPLLYTEDPRLIPAHPHGVH